jgi:membrane protease YdiL (CAAX protease family)
LGAGAVGDGPERAARGVSRARAVVELSVVALVLGAWYLLFTQTGFGERVHARSPAAAIALQVAVNAVLSLLLVALVLRLARQGWKDIGLGRAPPGPVLKWGLIGLVAMYASQAVLVVALSIADVGVAVWAAWFDVSGHVEEKRMLAEQFAVLPGTWVLPLAVLIGFYEELLFRGLVLSRVMVLVGAGGGGAPSAAKAQRLRVVAAALLTAALFAVGHVYQGALGVAQTFVAGLVLAALVIVRRTLWPAIFAHASVDLIGLVAARLLLPWLREQMPAP